MKIYDISQEVFSCAVYPGDPRLAHEQDQLADRAPEKAVVDEKLGS